MKTRKLILLTRNLAACSVFLFFAQCGPEEPETNGKINTTITLFSNAALQGKITVNQAFLNVSQVAVNGTAPTQDVLTFSRKLSGDDAWLSLLNKDQKPLEIVGKINDYDPFNVTLTLTSDTSTPVITEDESGISANLDEYLPTARPSLLLVGKFDNRGRSMPLIIAVNDVFPLTTAGVQYGSPQVRVDLENRLDIQISTTHIFSGVTTTALENAQRVNYQGQEAIFIHPLVNSGIYTSIEKSLEEASSSVIAKITVTKSRQDK